MADPDTHLSLQEEQTLVERAVSGDGEAFGRIYDAHKKALFTTVIYPKVGNATAAEEILQDTFLLAASKLAGFTFQDRSIFYWLRMIAINKCREWLAGAKRDTGIDSSVLDYQPDDSYQPENEIVAEDHAATLRRQTDDILTQINERYATAIRLRLVDSVPREECAARLDVSIETFDVLFFRACRAFREAYTRKYGAYP